MSNHDLRLLRSNGAEQDQVLGRRKGFGLFLDHFKISNSPWSMDRGDSMVLTLDVPPLVSE